MTYPKVRIIKMVKNQKLHARIESLVDCAIINDFWDVVGDPLLSILGGVPVSFAQTVGGIDDHQINGSRTWEMALEEGF